MTISVEDWDNVLFGMAKGLGMVQALMMSESDEIDKDKFQERIAEIQYSIDRMRYNKA